MADRHFSGDELRDRFNEAMRELHEPTGAVAERNAALAVGFLLGSDMPGCAATVAYLMRRCFPDRPFPTLFGEL
jgi:hypothetical protein